MTEVALWGTGEPSREFLYVDDAARALILARGALDVSEPVNIGTGRRDEIRELAETISELAGFEGKTVWDTSTPGRATEALSRRQPGAGADRLRGRDATGRGAPPHDRVLPVRRSGDRRFLRLASAHAQAHRGVGVVRLWLDPSDSGQGALGDLGAPRPHRRKIPPSTSSRRAGGPTGSTWTRSGRLSTTSSGAHCAGSSTTRTRRRSCTGF